MFRIAARKHSSCGVIVFMVAVHPVLANECGNGDLTATYEQLINDLRNERIEVRGAAHEHINGLHRFLVERLSQIAGVDKQRYALRDTRELAVELLGQVAARKSVTLMIRNVEYKQNMIVTEYSPLNGYPCARVLLNDVGPTCMPSIVDYLQAQGTENVSDKAIYLFAEIFWGCGASFDPVDGPEEEALGYVARSIRRGRDNQNVRRLHAELKRLVSERKGKVGGE
jgi:hypothetical protein